MPRLMTLAEYPVEEILPFIPSEKHKIVVEQQEYLVKLCSPRLQTFKKNLSCVRCGITGSIFKLQKPQSKRAKDESPHFNLFAVECVAGQLNHILITKDHIRPKSKGGSDDLDNLQTMCHVCNEKKGDLYDERRTL